MLVHSRNTSGTVWFGIVPPLEQGRLSLLKGLVTKPER
jgi:hypothetical protein